MRGVTKDRGRAENVVTNFTGRAIMCSRRIAVN